MEKVNLPYTPLLWIYSKMDRRDTVFLDSSMRNDLGTRSYLMAPYRIHNPGLPDHHRTWISIVDGTL